MSRDRVRLSEIRSPDKEKGASKPGIVCIKGKHISWTWTPDAVKRSLDALDKIADQMVAGWGGDFEEITISILRGLRELSYKDWELAVVEKKWVKILEIKL